MIWLFFGCFLWWINRLFMVHFLYNFLSVFSFSWISKEKDMNGELDKKKLFCFVDFSFLC